MGTWCLKIKQAAKATAQHFIGPEYPPPDQEPIIYIVETGTYSAYGTQATQVRGEAPTSQPPLERPPQAPQPGGGCVMSPQSVQSTASPPAYQPPRAALHLGWAGGEAYLHPALSTTSLPPYQLRADDPPPQGFTATFHPVSQHHPAPDPASYIPHILPLPTYIPTIPPPPPPLSLYIPTIPPLRASPSLPVQTVRRLRPTVVTARYEESVHPTIIDADADNAIGPSTSAASPTRIREFEDPRRPTPPPRRGLIPQSTTRFADPPDMILPPRRGSKRRKGPPNTPASTPGREIETSVEVMYDSAVPRLRREKMAPPRREAPVREIETAVGVMYDSAVPPLQPREVGWCVGQGEGRRREAGEGRREGEE